MADSRFKGLGSEELSKRGVYLEDGLYDIEVDKMEYLPAEKNRAKEDFIVIQMTLLASNNSKHPVGAKRNHMIKMSDPDRMGFKALKKVIYALLGKDFRKDEADCKSKIDPNIEAIAESAVDPEKNGFAGSKAKLEVKTIKTKSGKDFAEHTYFPYVAPKAEDKAA